MKCKFCGCTDERPCLIPMYYGVHPLSFGRSPFDFEQLPVVTSYDQIAEFTTPCHWSARNICSAPACVEKAHAETCEAIDQLMMVAGKLVA